MKHSFTWTLLFVMGIIFRGVVLAQPLPSFQDKDSSALFLVQVDSDTTRLDEEKATDKKKKNGLKVRTLDVPFSSAEKKKVASEDAESISQLESEADSSFTDPQYVKEPPLKRISFNGYYRLLLYHRDITKPYPDLPPFQRAYGVGDVYREPMLSFWVNGRPNGKTSFGTELFVFAPYLGTGPNDNVFQMNLGLNLYGSVRTKFGRFNMRAGGISWYSLSSMTLSTFQVFDKYSIFERTPWEGVDEMGRYDAFYETGSVNRGDRWGFAAYQGFIMDAVDLPGQLDVSLIYGKTQVEGGLGFLNLDQDGNILVGPAINDPLETIQNPGTAGNVPTYQGFAGTARVIPNGNTGWRVKKKFGENYIAYNGLVNWLNSDSIERSLRTYQVHSIDYRWNLQNKVMLAGEVGVGKFVSPNYEGNLAPAIVLGAEFSQEFSKIPFTLGFFHIDPDYFNENGVIQTFSNPEIPVFAFGRQQLGQPFAAGQLNQAGQYSHNRQGGSIGVGYNWEYFKFFATFEAAREIEVITQELSYVHRINNLAISRIYNPFPQNATGPTVAGPYGRLFTFFRGAYEVVKPTDFDPLTGNPVNRKYWHVIDANAKIKIPLKKENIYLFYLTTIGSISNKFTGVPISEEDSYIFAQYHELDLYVPILPWFILTGYAGLESIKGGYYTEWDEVTGQPRDQIGQGYGIGCDLTLAPNAGLFFRHRWMDFRDRNFQLDRYKGTETTLELKIFF